MSSAFASRQLTFKLSRALRNRARIRYTSCGTFTAFVDVAILLVSAAAALRDYDSIVAGHDTLRVMCVLLLSVTTAGTLYVLLARISGLYNRIALMNADGRMGQAFCILLATALVGSAGILADLRGSAFWITPLLTFALLFQMLLMARRNATARVMKWLSTKDFLVGPSVVVLGDEQELEYFSEDRLGAEFGLREVGRVAIGEATASQVQAASESALAMARIHKAERLVIALRWQDQDRLSCLQSELGRSALPAFLLPDGTVRRVMDACSTHKRSLTGVVALQSESVGQTTKIAKRGVDLLISTIALALLSPIMIAAAIAIKIESEGPVIFRQRRHGLDRRPFTILKFRSMTVLEDGASVIQASKHDPRVTRVGSILRQTSIDEIPQLLNVLKGDMSLVGPRPHALAHDDAYGAVIEQYTRRHRVKPGITGWAQINGARGQTESVQKMKSRVDLDLWYIKHCSLWLDLVILARTCVEVVKREAY